MPFDRHIDPEKMSISELSDAVLSMVNNAKSEIADHVDLRDLLETDKHRKLIEVVEDLIKKDGKVTRLSADTLYAIRVGIMFGIATTIKFNTKSSVLRESAENGDDEIAKKQIRDFLFIFAGLEKGANEWEDSTWYENLIKNAIIEEAPKKNDSSCSAVKHTTKKKKAL